MAINTRSEYALRALLEIADSPQEALSAQKICDHQALPKKYSQSACVSARRFSGLAVST